MDKATITVEGMHCGSCGMLIDDALEELPGVKSSATKVRKGRTVVEFDDTVTNLEDIRAAIVELGYQTPA